MRRLGCLAAVTCLSLAAQTASGAEKVTLIPAGASLQLRAHSSTHITVGARKMQMLYAPGLESGCTSVYLYADNDPVLYKTLAAAVMMKSAMTLIYDVDTDKRGPWGDPLSCPLTSVTVQP